MSALQELETRLAGLQALIARRESQVGNHQHEGSFSDTSRHIAAARKELRDVATQYIMLKCSGNGWEPLEVIERMTAPKATHGQTAGTTCDSPPSVRD